MEGSGESTLRAKYLDWCSARLAERFLDLSPEEIYALARPDAPDRTGAGSADEPPDASPGAAAEPLASGPPAPSSPGSTGPAGEAEPDAGETEPTRSSSSLPDPTDDDYRVLVQRVTEALLKRTSLPTFEQWAEAYAETPERFDAELLGFWKDVVGEEPTEAEGD